MLYLQWDGPLDISTGGSRFEEKWTPKVLQWSELVARLKETTRTTETTAVYWRMSKSEQDRIKDVGGFVGGLIEGGKRKPGNVKHRQLVTLDLDKAPVGLWEQFCDLYEAAACVYSTHKHRADKPRLRLLIPLDRPVSADEYEAISRRIAGDIGIEAFDPTTFQVNRLMYWPSTSVDGEYVYEIQDGSWLEADRVLGSYSDWRQISDWPYHPGAEQRRREGMTEAGDPLEKPGLIGAFCRVYGIRGAIEKFLNDVYTPTGTEDRFTYTHGSTAGGLVVYGDRWAYSHHSTDAAGGRLCNAFDLVRIHRFGGMDEDVKEQTPLSRYPSHLAMLDFIREMPDISGDVMERRLTELKGIDFDFEETDWLKELDVDRKGNPKETIDNCLKILENDPRLGGKIWMDDFFKRQVVKEGLPWRADKRAGYWMDSDDAGMRQFMETEYGIVARPKIDDSLQILWDRHRFHPVREYLLGLVWDGRERVDRLLINHLGAENSEYVRTVTRKTLCACVARVMQPGVKFDTVLVLVGAQGIGKSSLIADLGGPWYSDTFTAVKGKEAYEQLQGVWLLEMGELAGLRKAEVDEIKHFVSKKYDTFRPAYAKRVEYFPRQCVFFGTTNNDEFLQDMTGNRRWWPVRVQANGRTSVDVPQIWAEAVVKWKAGETLYLDEKMENTAKKIQLEHLERYPHAGAIEEYLEQLFPAGWDDMPRNLRRVYLNQNDWAGTDRKMRFCVAEIWEEVLGLNVREMTRYNTRELNGFLKNMSEWQPGRAGIRFSDYGKQREYVRMSNNSNNSLVAIVAADNQSNR